MQNSRKDFFQSLIQLKGIVAKFTLEYPILPEMKLTLWCPSGDEKYFSWTQSCLLMLYGLYAGIS